MVDGLRMEQVQAAMKAMMDKAMAVVADLPALCQVRHKLQVRVEDHKTAEQLDDHAGRGGIGRQMRIEGGWVGPESSESPAWSRLGRGGRLGDFRRHSLSRRRRRLELLGNRRGRGSVARLRLGCGLSPARDRSDCY